MSRHSYLSLPPRRRAPIAAMNVVPYVDVMLVLLIIFMVTAPLLHQGIAVRLPTTASHALAASQKPIIVSVDAKGRYFLNIAAHPRKPLSLRAVVLRIKQAHVPAARAVLIKGDTQLTYGKVVNLMGYLRKAGIRQVGLITHPPTV